MRVACAPVDEAFAASVLDCAGAAGEGTEAPTVSAIVLMGSSMTTPLTSGTSRLSMSLARSCTS